MDINSTVNQISNTLTQLIKAEIKNKGLISDENKPHLYDSIYAVPIINGLDFKVDVRGFYYFKYLDARYGIMDAVKTTSEYKEIQHQILLMYKDQIREKIRNAKNK